MGASGAKNALAMKKAGKGIFAPKTLGRARGGLRQEGAAAHGGYEGHLGVHQAGRHLEEGAPGGVVGHAEDGRVRLEAPQVNARFSLVPESLSVARGAETWSDRSRRFWHDCGETRA